MTDSSTLPRFVRDGRVGRVELRDPARRNALDAQAIASLVDALRTAHTACDACDDSARIDAVVLRGEGHAFCSGFDLAGCAEEPRRVEPLLDGLSAAVRALRAIPAPVVARVQGAALAGGCALLTGCDFVVVAPDAQLGYPVHRIGISPAVSAPSLFSRMGSTARALLMSGELLDGHAALRLGLATHLAADAAQLDAETDRLTNTLLAKGPQALRATKAWIASIEARGSGALGPARGCDDEALDAVRDASLALAAGEEFATMLRAFWSSKQAADRSRAAGSREVR